MAQSRMAGMAMDLGPSDLADVGEAATLATNKMGMEQGQQAGVLMDVARNGRLAVNDGNPRVVIVDGNRMTVNKDPRAANPTAGGYGMAAGGRMSPQLRNKAANILHNSPNSRDTISGNGNRRGEDMYRDAMSEGYTFSFQGGQY